MNTLFIAGDLCLIKEVEISSDIVNKINYSNGFIANYESVFTPENAELRNDKNAILISSKKSLESFLEQIKVPCAFGLGNNHIHDMGEDGIKETKKTFKTYTQISFFGAGYIDTLLKPLELTINQKKVCFLAVSSDSYEVMSKSASENFEGILNIEMGLENLISSLKHDCDFLIIYAHIGKEYIYYPRTEIRQFAHRWIDLGADAVIAHHPHVIQGKENYKGKPVYYSLGNFIFPNFSTKNGQEIRWAEENNFSIMLELEISNQLNFTEYGLYFDTKRHKLSFSDVALDKLHARSDKLDINAMPLKEYYGFWEKEYLRYLNKQYSFINRAKRKLKRIFI